MARFVVRSRRVLTEGGLAPRDVVVSGERIEAVLPHGAAKADLPVTDLGELALLPGLVDCHVHINEPGRTDWEGFETATRAAAQGGVTTLVDMPLNCIPVTTTVDAFAAKLDAVDGKLAVDVGFWGGVVPGNAGELGGLARAGVLGCKAFLCHSGIDDFPASDEAVLREAMPRLRDAGIPLLAHAELEATLGPIAAPARSYASWLEARPRSFEDTAIALLADLAKDLRCPVHVVHLSSASAVPVIRAARADGVPLSVETCPHYLCLTAEEVPDGDTRFKCAPPIREASNREALWEALRAGVVDLVVTDHSPCTPGLKRLDTGSFPDAWGGIGSLSLGLSSVWTEARARGVALAEVARWMSEAPARVAGVTHRKGRIAAGLDADLVAFDPDAEREVHQEDLPFKNRISPYDGRRLRGVVRTTWLRGDVIYEDGAHRASPGGRPLLHRDGVS